MAEVLAIKPADLLIDEENPRISTPNSGQNKTLQALGQSLGKKVQALAEDIVAHGLNPSDLPLVMNEPGSPTRYRVLEGNRRLAAIKSLENPEVLDGSVESGVLKRIRQLSKEYLQNPIDEVRCLVLKDRDEGRHWIELRHTGQNKGAGIVEWGHDEQQRFKARTGPPEAYTQALNFLQERGDLTAEKRAALPTTTFKRLIETPVVRTRLGVDIRQRQLVALSFDHARIAKALMYIVNELVSGKLKVGAVYTKEQRAQYAGKLPTDVVVPATVKSAQASPLSGTMSAATPKTATTKSLKAKQRDRLIPKDCVLGIPSGRVQQIEHELRRLSLGDYTNAVSVLFRVFIELSVDTYVEKHKLAGHDEKTALQKKMAAVADDLVKKSKLTQKQRTPVSRACQKDSFLAPSITLMHQFVHNQHVYPVPGDLRAHWDNLQPFFGAIWAA